eukprot:7376110-Prymnesium_polylepis.1
MTGGERAQERVAVAPFAASAALKVSRVWARSASGSHSRFAPTPSPAQGIPRSHESCPCVR